MISDWLKRKLAMVALATANVEKNAFNNQGNMLSDGIGHQRLKTTDSLSEALKRGEVTAEVEALRWRMYKIIDHLDGRKTNIIGTELDENGDERYITETVAKRKPNMRQYMVDPYDSYPLEIIVVNDKTVMGITEANQKLEDQTIMVNRSNLNKVDIEYSTTKMCVRDIGGGQKLLEFYISQYPNEFDRKTRLMISELERCSNGFKSNILDIDGVGFQSVNSTIGVSPNLLYEYEILGFDKIVKFNGHYIVKFKANVIVDGENIFEKYRVESLDQKYNENLSKKNTDYYL
jgi:hypothetical protein